MTIDNFELNIITSYFFPSWSLPCYATILQNTRMLELFVSLANGEEGKLLLSFFYNDAFSHVLEDLGFAKKSRERSFSREVNGEE